MTTAREVLKQFYGAAIARDLAKARTYLHDDLVFVGLIETYRCAEDYIAAFTGLLQVTVRLNVKAIVVGAMRPLFSLSWRQRRPLRAS